MFRKVRSLLVVSAVVGTLIVTSAAAIANADGRGGLVTAYVGESIKIPGVDLFCTVYAHDLNHVDPGPALYCQRYSDTVKSSYSASILATLYHLEIAKSNSHYFSYQVARDP
jgi:hypothetical protein